MDELDFIKLALSEDVGSGDHTTLACIPNDSKGSARLLVKAEGIIAGVQIAKNIFHHIEPEMEFISHVKDGSKITNGMVAFEVIGKIQTILTCERLALNCMQRMSGIATLTAKYVEAVKPYGTRILDTRKTTPLFRNWEKQAVSIGGGFNHRMGLYDMILIKDNHIDFAGSITNAITRAKKYLELKNMYIPIEVETRNLDEVKEVMDNGGVDRIMLDNFNPILMRDAIEIIANTIETEASGGITLSNIAEYAATGVNNISVGALTHSATSLDLSLKATFK
ncbi:MAG: carboxylating nicotinate-nucleotide diphosphorylase [Bacteroidota bacterium]|jgi:nicotinate-nucleotide pyrophosphorylase (carboxylating)